MKIQMYVAQPSESGQYEVAKWCEKEQNYITFENNLSKEFAINRARKLNEEESGL